MYNHISDDENGPVKSAKLLFQPATGKHEGTVLGLGIGIGCLGELSAGARTCFILLNVPLRDLSHEGHAAIFRLERPHLGPEP